MKIAAVVPVRIKGKSFIYFFGKEGSVLSYDADGNRWMQGQTCIQELSTDKWSRSDGVLLGLALGAVVGAFLVFFGY